MNHLGGPRVRTATNGLAVKMADAATCKHERSNWSDLVIKATQVVLTIEANAVIHWTLKKGHDLVGCTKAVLESL